MTKFSELQSISPIDGRYRSRVTELVPYFSQFALDRERVYVEVEYLIELSKLDQVKIELPPEELRKIYEGFEIEDSQLIRQIDQDGYQDIAPTHHDVKAVEYYLRMEIQEANLEELVPFIHFGLTSEDVNNLAYNRLIKGAAEGPMVGALLDILGRLADLVEANADQPMLGRTHGQPATPTTLGKEFAVFLSRLIGGLEKLRRMTGELTGKLAGATGNLSAHRDSFSRVDWLEFSESFVSRLGLKPNAVVTQIEPYDNLADLFHCYSSINNVLLDLARDCWTYISQGYFSQKAVSGEVGSSTMPQKVNPIDFENGEGNLSKANSDLEFLASYLTTSRMQRDLSDSTVRRNIGVAFAHSLIGYKSVLRGLNKIEPNKDALDGDLERHPEVLSESWQTSMRKYGHIDAYEVVKDLVRGKDLDYDEVIGLIDELPLPTNEKARLKKLTPKGYVGLAEELAESVAEEARRVLEESAGS
ncbi:MAG: adenylosuccinate lyase [Candidatus Bipolaricaulota bacterium]